MKRLAGSTDPSFRIGSVLKYRALLIPALSALAVTAACGNTSDDDPQDTEAFAVNGGDVATGAPEVPGQEQEVNQEQNDPPVEAQPVSASELEITADIFDKPLPDIDFGFDTSPERTKKVFEYLTDKYADELAFVGDLEQAYSTGSTEELSAKGYTRDDLVVMWYVAAINFDQMNTFKSQINQERENVGDVGFYSAGVEDEYWAYTTTLASISSLDSSGVLDTLPSEVGTINVDANVAAERTRTLGANIPPNFALITNLASENGQNPEDFVATIQQEAIDRASQSNSNPTSFDGTMERNHTAHGVGVIDDYANAVMLLTLRNN